MSDVLTINTDVAAGLKKPEQKVEPLSVFDERHPMMAEIMPEFIGVLPNTSMTHFQMACINPKVIEVSEELIKDNEGCLSFPAFFLKIPRPKWIEVEYTNENGERTQTRLDGLTARCYLHELDHLNGVKFTNYAGSVAMAQAKRKQEKMIKRIVRKK